MRILVLAKDFPSPGQPDGGIVVIRQLQALRQLGHEVLVVRVVPHAPAWTERWRAYRSVPQRYAIDGIEVRALRAFFPPRMLAMEYLPFQVGPRVQTIAREFDPDIVHAHCLIPSGQLAARLSLPTIVTAHGSDAYDWAQRRNGLRRAAIEAIGHATTVVAVSDFIRRHVRALVDRDVSVIYNGADERVFSQWERSQARDALRIPQDRFVIAFAGRLTKSKGLHDLLTSASRIGNPRPLLLLAGSRCADLDAKALAGSCGVDAVTCGMLDLSELARVFAAADVFCLPSYREGLPLVVCEAMLAGLPIVATRVGGIPEIVADNTSGFLVEPGNTYDLERGLLSLGQDPSLARRMGLSARDFARRHLTWAANARAYEALYRRAIDVAA